MRQLRRVEATAPCLRQVRPLRWPRGRKEGELDAGAWRPLLWPPLLRFKDRSGLARELVVSIDAMGGDHAPQAIIDGVGHAHVRHPKVRFLLHGDHARLQPVLLSKPSIK